MDINDAVKFLGDMKVVDLIALTKELEQKWGVKAEPQLTQAPIVLLGEAKEAVAQEEFSVFVVSVPTDKKIAVIKAIRDITGLGLKECKEVIEKAPQSVKDGVSKDMAEDLKSRLVEAGAIAEIK